MKRRDVRLNHVFLPFALVILWPSLWWLLALPADFLWTGFVLFCVLKLLRVSGVRRTIRKALGKIFLFGLLADAVTVGLLLVARREWSGWWAEYIAGPLASNPFDNRYVLWFTVGAVLFDGVLCCLFYYFFVFRRIDMERFKKRTVSAILAFCTMPYLLLVPTGLVSGEGFYVFTNHILSPGYGSAEIERLGGKKAEDAVLYTGIGTLVDVVNRAEPLEELPERTREISYRFWFPSAEREDAASVELRFGDTDPAQPYFVDGERVYAVREEDVSSVTEMIAALEEREFTYRYMIVDQTVVADTTPEFLLSDGQYNFYLSSQRSRQVILVFEGGDVFSLREALEMELVDIYDLIRNGLDVIPVLIEQDAAFRQENAASGAEPSGEPGASAEEAG